MRAVFFHSLESIRGDETAAPHADRIDGRARLEKGRGWITARASRGAVARKAGWRGDLGLKEVAHRGSFLAGIVLGSCVLLGSPAFAGTRIAVLDFELNDLTLLPRTPEELARTAGVAPSLREAW